MTEQRDADSLSADSQQLSQTPGDRLESENLPPALPADDSWKNRIANIWHKTTPRLGQLLPVDQLAQTVVQWFSVSESQIAEILQTVRAELPTTEALLIGKPQAGKSSIVRGLTGVSADIVGQGFRPHTQHTQRYAYPSDDLPLLIFTDTVGLGDVKQDTQEIIQELVGDLEQSTRSARILILTVKINDFATDTLRQIAQQLRQQYPDIPCLLAVTCLHEVYPPQTMDHPAYPPDYEEINRAFNAIQEDFAKVCVGEASPKETRSVLIDFTLEEDGYNPVFYGLEALRDNLAELLPEAEAKAIYQLLDREEAGKQLGNLYRDAGRRYILPFAIMAATLAAVPLPFATMPVLTALQVSMVTALGNLYGQKLTPSQAGGVVSAIAGGFLAQAIARELIKFVPGFGSVIAASWAAAYTWSLGETACVYFGDLMGGKKPDPKKIQSVMQEAFKAAQERFKGIKR
ncbi:50S ribosome-binding GTPase [Tolypothrix sp. FACHB-123]|uniref:GTPase family protein n=1 Tax=Tolypothrix sp. FACHB-123 TaxID=2692868 RepID=UPI001688E936|nr:GTPase [Tolypothrix sp. FACHB-123]MBD2354906.1 50S ribosome-binding GTPase [Tolypothrix sp. FACHB-123]